MRLQLRQTHAHARKEKAALRDEATRANSNLAVRDEVLDGVEALRRRLAELERSFGELLAPPSADGRQLRSSLVSQLDALVASLRAVGAAPDGRWALAAGGGAPSAKPFPFGARPLGGGGERSTSPRALERPRTAAAAPSSPAVTAAATPHSAWALESPPRAAMRGSASLSQLPRSPVGSTTWQELRARSALNLGAKAGRSPGAAG